MIEVSIDSLRNYQACTLYYKFEHIDNIKNRTTQLKQTRQHFKETLTAIVNFFFYKKMSWQEPSYKSLEARWEKKWIKDASAKDLVINKTSATNAYPTDAYYTTKATAALRIFHNWFSKTEDSEVVLIDESFIVPLNRDVSLTGSFDCILRTPNKDGGYNYQIYVWSINLGNKSVDYWSTHFTALDYAFRYRNNFDKTLNVSYYLWDFTDPVPGVKQYVIDKKDHYIMGEWAKNVAETYGEHYPIRSLSAYCKGCKFDKLCLNWKPEEKVDE